MVTEKQSLKKMGVSFSLLRKTLRSRQSGAVTGRASQRSLESSREAGTGGEQGQDKAGLAVSLLRGHLGSLHSELAETPLTWDVLAAQKFNSFRLK